MGSSPWVGRAVVPGVPRWSVNPIRVRVFSQVSRDGGPTRLRHAHHRAGRTPTLADATGLLAVLWASSRRRPSCGAGTHSRVRFAGDLAACRGAVRGTKEGAEGPVEPVEDRFRTAAYAWDGGVGWSDRPFKAVARVRIPLGAPP